MKRAPLRSTCPHGVLLHATGTRRAEWRDMHPMHACTCASLTCMACAWLIEKDAAFMRLAEDRFYNTYPCVIISGKGQPDVATRLFLNKVCACFITLIAC